MKAIISAVFVTVVAAAGLALAQQAQQMRIVTPAEVKFAKGPPSLPAGAELATLAGDMSKPAPFTVRIRVPDGYRIMPHYHPVDERLTVLQGTLLMGHGDKFDLAKAKEVPVGGLVITPASTHHYVQMRGETVVQLDGTGPWGITYLNPGDDPRATRSSR